MAFEIVQAMHFRTKITHEVHHDLESFVWVLCYSVGRRFVTQPPVNMKKDRREQLRDFLHEHFGRLLLFQICLSRNSVCIGPLSITDKFPELFSEPLRELFASLNVAVVTSFMVHHRGACKYLSYEFLFRLLDVAIMKLENPCSGTASSCTQLS